MPRKKMKIEESAAEILVDLKEKIDDEHQEVNQPQLTITFEMVFWEKIWKVESELGIELMKINYKRDNKILASIYNPLDYAKDLHIQFLKKYLKKAPEVLFLGMNPGLNGMAQSAVPFGNTSIVRQWMKISGKVNKPDQEIPAKPIVGLDCKIEEPSGKRFWGLLQELCGEPENFFDHCWVHNICPLAFLTATGRNITPTELKGDSKKELNTICLQYLKTAIDTFNPKIIVAIGSYANDRVKELKQKHLIVPEIDCKLLPHPSPRALNNQNWVEKAKQWYIDNDIIKYFQH